jgi:hypothetical protein
MHVKAEKKLISQKWRVEQWSPEPGKVGEESVEQRWLIGTGVQLYRKKNFCGTVG